MPETFDGDSGEIVPSSSKSSDEQLCEEFGIGLPLSESGKPAGRAKGFRGLLRLIGACVKQLCISGVRYVHGKAEEPMARVQDMESQIHERYADGRRRQEKHLLEMEQLRLAIEKDRADRERQKKLDDAQAMLREQAEADIHRHLTALAKLGVSVSLVPAPNVAGHDLLNDADQMLESGTLHGAATVARLALEEHLGEMCVRAKCLPSKPQGTARNYAEALANAGLLTVGDTRLIRSMADVGNRAAHNIPGITYDEVKNFLQDLRNFRELHPLK
jgi:hypothetical protein